VGDEGRKGEKYAKIIKLGSLNVYPIKKGDFLVDSERKK
jgi:hypothetical protein